jgi:MarR family transcriptional regulator, lower aerobic nicotinate degradation pathway regulator
MRTPDDPANARFTNLPSWLMTQTAMHAHRLVADGLAAVDARGYHYRVLATLDQFGPASQAALGRRSGIHLSDLVAAINELADRELVQRAPDPADRRRNIITITSAGRRQLRRLDKQVTQIQDDLLAPLSPDERDQLTRLLTRILDHHSRAAAAVAADHDMKPKRASSAGQA